MKPNIELPDISDEDQLIDGLCRMMQLAAMVAEDAEAYARDANGDAPVAIKSNGKGEYHGGGKLSICWA